MAEMITSRDNDRVKYARRLASSGSFRAGEGLFFAEGRRLCLDLAQNGTPKTVFCTEEFLRSCPEAETLGGECFLVTSPVAEKLAGTQHSQGIFCLFPLPEDAPAQLRPNDGILLCEELQDPVNVGAALRSAAAFGFGGAVFVGGADPFAPKALRAGMGAALRLPVARLQSFAAALELLRGKNAALYAAAAGEKSRPPEELARKGPFALMVGNEGAGLSNEAVTAADALVGIPMQSGVESLNAAVAASVLMYVLKSQ